MKLFVLFTVRTPAKDLRLNTDLEWSSPPRNIDDVRAMEEAIADSEGVDGVQVTIERAEPFYGQVLPERAW